jgi:hypothetical protein
MNFTAAAAAGIEMNKIKVQILREITDWNKVKGYKVPNHTYVINAATHKLIAYMKEGTDNLIAIAGKGLTFDRRGRQFDVKWRYINI